MQEQRYRIQGMDCASCGIAIERALRPISGILEISVNYASQEARVQYDPDSIDSQRIAEAINKLGYAVVPVGVDQGAEKVSDERGLFLSIPLVVALAGAALLVAGTVFDLGLLSHKWVMALIASIVQFGPGFRFYQRLYRDITARVMTMDTLIALGTSVAYGYSLCVLLFESTVARTGISPQLYFETSATIIALVLLGNHLEESARRRTTSAIRGLMRLQPASALVRRSDAQGTVEWISVPVEEVGVGDVLRIRPGDGVPVDGRVVSGESSVNEAMVTGESVPAKKKVGDAVIGGTINLSGVLEMEATKVGADTMLATIIALVQRAQSSKMPVQRIVDQVSAIFVPVVIVLSIISFLGWFFFGPEPQLLNAVINMVTVLIIACPCALGLATPTSVIVGMGRGANEGILIKDAQALELAGTIETMIFDKTGTLTRGIQDVEDFQLADGMEEGDVYQLTAAVESRSNHPVSHAVMRYIMANKPNALEGKQEVAGFEALSGLGVRAQVDGRAVLIGSQQLLENEGVAITDDARDCIVDWQKRARTVSLVAIDGKQVAHFCLADMVREGARETIAQLEDLGVTSIMITGDSQAAAQAVASMLGITDFLARVLPSEKAEQVKKLQEDGTRVGMVGDGINDAPALAQADVGIAVGGGTAVALETADVALLRNDITLVPRLVRLSRATLKNIRQNLVWAFGYNVLLIPVAMGILYPLFGIMMHPMLAGAAMAFSSLSVVLNALRLRWVKIA